jgi:ATP-dependent Lon protease
MFGVADWNTLSAVLQADRRDTFAPATRLKTSTALYPAIPLRDLVPFPNATYPMFVGREKTMHALNQAFEGGREVVVAIQREASVDDPRFSDVYEIGILAQLLELETLGDGTLRVLTRGLRRVELRSFAAESVAYQAEVADVSEGVARDARDLIRRTISASRTIRRLTEFLCRTSGCSSIKRGIPDRSPILSRRG